MSEPLLSVSGLKTNFDTRHGLLRAVDDVSFSLDRGEILGLVGESGSGKAEDFATIQREIGRAHV